MNNRQLRTFIITTKKITPNYRDPSFYYSRASNKYMSEVRARINNLFYSCHQRQKAPQSPFSCYFLLHYCMPFTERQLDELDIFFKKTKFPPIVQLDAGTTITNVPTFINSHPTVLRNNMDKPIYEAFHQRLIALKTSYPRREKIRTL